MLGAALLLISSCRFINFNGDVATCRDGEPLELVNDTTFLAGFTGFECNVPADVVFSKGPASVEIKASESLKSKIAVFLKDSVLSIGFTERVKIKDRGDIDIKISSETLEYICLNGAVDFRCADSLTAKSFRLTANGACNCEFGTLIGDEAGIEFNGASEAKFTNLAVGELKVEINGAGDAEFRGRCDSARIEINGTGQVDAGGLVCSDINSEVNGIGFVKKPGR